MPPAPPGKPSSRRDATLIRRLTEAATGDNPRSAWVGLLFAAILGAIVMGAIYGILLSGGPPERVIGVVVGFGLTESDEGSYPLVRVAVDNREATIPIPRGGPCRLGERIELDRRKGLLGYKYDARFRGCGG